MFGMQVSFFVSVDLRKTDLPPFPASFPDPRTTASSRNAGSLCQLLLYRISLLKSAIHEILLKNAKRTSGLASHSLF